MELAVQERAILGRKTKHLRNEGQIPAELYGHWIENRHITVALKDFRKAFKAAGENTIVTLVVGKDKHPVLIHDINYDHVSDEILSVDFYQVNMKEKLKVKVPIEFRGEASAVKEKGGILLRVMSEIEVEALPDKIPHSVAVDLAVLKDIGNSIHIKDLSISNEYAILVEPDMVIVTIKAPLTEEEEKALETAAAVPAEVAVETEEKKAERAAAKEEGAIPGAPGAGGAKPAAGAKPAGGKEAIPPSKAPAAPTPQKKS